MFSLKSLGWAAAAVLLLASLFCAPASASVMTYDFTFDGKAFDLTGQMTVDPVGNAKGGYKIDSLTGTYTASILGKTIEGELTGLTTTPCFPCAKADNILYLQHPFVDSRGIGITTDGIFSFDIFSNQADLMHVAIFGLFVGNDPGVLTISAAVPEPSTWAMIILGFLGLAMMTYRRRRQTGKGGRRQRTLCAAD
jgi:PEP-CTERM motif